jgi:type IV pilus assembly protein PilN
VAGVAQTNERVSEFLRNTQYNSKWLERPELVEIKVLTAQTTKNEQRRLFDFSMRVTLKRPAPPAPATPSAPAPVAAAAKSA